MSRGVACFLKTGMLSGQHFGLQQAAGSAARRRRATWIWRILEISGPGSPGGGTRPRSIKSPGRRQPAPRGGPGGGPVGAARTPEPPGVLYPYSAESRSRSNTALTCRSCQQHNHRYSQLPFLCHLRNPFSKCTPNVNDFCSIDSWALFSFILETAPKSILLSIRALRMVLSVA